ncbi:MAG: FAD/NAD(P)-binding protein [Firmicutes bacterium]|nr:FAD/NAD(P)-binding protein [Bacillota bacterium]
MGRSEAAARPEAAVSDAGPAAGLYLPSPATIQEVRLETGAADVRTFKVTLDGQEIGKDFIYRPGQCAMVSVFGVGEVMLSLSSSPTWTTHLEFSVKNAGKVTSTMHGLAPGARLGVRGPLGNWFPYESLQGKDLLFVGGGIGLAPLRSLINYVIDNRDRYGKVEIIYGARSPQDLCFKSEIFETWPKAPDTEVFVTVDRGDADWKGKEGFVPAYLEELAPSPVGKVAVICGPPIMIKFVLQGLEKLGYSDEQVITTLEMRMKCGVGKCGRCNIGHKYVCVDGPVFNLAQLRALKGEFV